MRYAQVGDVVAACVANLKDNNPKVATGSLRSLQVRTCCSVTHIAAHRPVAVTACVWYGAMPRL